MDHWPSVSPLASSSLVELHLCPAFLSSSPSWGLFSSLHLLLSCWYSSSFSSRWSSWAVRGLCQHLLSSLSNHWSNHCKYKQTQYISVDLTELKYVFKDHVRYTALCHMRFEGNEHLPGAAVIIRPGFFFLSLFIWWFSALRSCFRLSLKTNRYKETEDYHTLFMPIPEHINGSNIKL